MAEPSSELVARALAADRAAVRTLIAQLLPVVEARVMRALGRRGRSQGHGRDPRQELDDLTQEVFAALFAEDARVLRSWDPARGLSLLNFVGLVAERQVGAIFRTGRRSPWTEDPTLAEDLEGLGSESGSPPEGALASRELFTAVLARLREQLSPLGMQLFQSLVVDELPAAEVAARSGMTMEAVYAWRSRLLKLVRKLAGELEAEPVSGTAGRLQRPVGDGEP